MQTRIPHFFLTFLLLASMSPCRLNAQSSLQREPSHHLGADGAFNSNDVFLGPVFYLADIPDERFSILFSISLRPFGKKLLIQDSPGTYLYVREERITVLAGIDRQEPLTEMFGLFASAAVGWTYPKYRGLARDLSSGIAPVVTAGFQWSFPDGNAFEGDWFALRFGGAFHNLDEDRFRLYASILVAL